MNRFIHIPFFYLHLLSVIVLSLVVVCYSPAFAHSQTKMKTVGELLARVKKRHPTLVLARMKFSGLKKVAKVSGAWPNVSLGYQREQLFPAVGQDQLTVQLAIPLGGRTFRKKDVAVKMSHLQKLLLKGLQLRVSHLFLKRYYRWLYLQKKIAVARQLSKQFRTLRGVLVGRIKGGSVAAMELTRFDLEVEQQRQKLRLLQESAKQLSLKISQQAGTSQAALPGIQASLLPVRARVRLPKLSKWVPLHPWMRYLQARISLAKGRLHLARARAMPDLSVSLGYLRQEASGAGQPDSHGFMLGLSVPLPIFQRNQAGVQKARMVKRLSRRQLKVQSKVLTLRIVQAFQRYQRSAKRWKGYQKRVLSRIPKLLHAAQVSFRSGTSFSHFLSTYRSIEGYQQFGLSLQYQLRKVALTLEESLGYVPLQ